MKCCIGVLGVSLSIDYVDLIPVDIPQHDTNMNTLISVTLFFNFRDNSRAFLIITSLVENDKLDMRFSKICIIICSQRVQNAFSRKSISQPIRMQKLLYAYYHYTVYCMPRILALSFVRTIVQLTTLSKHFFASKATESPPFPDLHKFTENFKTTSSEQYLKEITSFTII